MRKNGAEIILISYASPLSPDKRRETWMRHLPARAYDNGVFIGAVNMVGDNGRGTVFGGGIMAFDPKGRTIAEHFSEDDHVVTFELSSSIHDALGSDEDMGNTDYFRYRRNDIY
jgi:predicted amidohydrolase